MRWFKHFSDNYRGRTVQRLLDEMGHSGALAYYFVLELCAEKLEKTPDKTVSESDCVFVFNRKVIENVTRMKRKSTDKLGIIGAECGVWEWKPNGNEIIIKMPILLDLLDRDLKGTRSRRAQDAKKPRLELELESELELELESDKEEERVAKRKAPSATALPLLAQVWNQNCGGLAKVQSCNGPRKRQAAARWREAPSAEHWAQVVEKIKMSAFCGGKNDRGWRADFDWLIKPDTAHRVLEGRYDDRNSAKGQSDEYWKQVFGSEATQ